MRTKINVNAKVGDGIIGKTGNLCEKRPLTYPDMKDREARDLEAVELVALRICQRKLVVARGHLT
jgi:hypothetical protein